MILVKKNTHPGKRAFGRISENDSLQEIFPDFQWLPCYGPLEILIMCNPMICSWSKQFYLESLLITLIKAPFSSFSLWLSAFRSGSICQRKTESVQCLTNNNILNTKSLQRQIVLLSCKRQMVCLFNTIYKPIDIKILLSRLVTWICG